MKTVLAELSEDEWRQAREVIIKIRAIEANPTAYTKEETERAVRADMDLSIHVSTKHNIPSTQNWEFCLSTGEIISIEE